MMRGRTMGLLAVLVLLSIGTAVNAQSVLLNGSPNPISVTSNGQVVTVSVTGVTSLNTNDAFALYPASSSNPAQNPPFKYKVLTYSGAGAARGVSTTFSVPNIRQDFIVAYLSNTNTNVQPVAGFPVLNGTIVSTNRIVQANPNEPTQVHLGLTTIPTQVQVTWTVSPTPPLQFIQFGTASGVYTQTVAASQFVTYTPASMCGLFTAVNSFIDPGLFVTATITVAPNTKIYYRVGTLNTTATTSAEFSFTTPPLVGSPVKVILSADMAVTGAADGSTLVNAAGDMPLNTIAGITNEVQNNGFTLVTMNGDLAYADGYLSYWDLFMNSIQPFTALAPFQVVDGNHERDYPQSGDDFSPNPGNKGPQGANPICTASKTGPFVTCDSKGECGTITATRFTQPGVPNFTPSVAPTSGPSRQKWYSYNYGVLHMLHYSTEESYAPGSPQYQFIANDLASVDRTLTPWVVVHAHRPFYADSTDFSGLPDPSKGNVIAPATADEDDGDQYVARKQRQYLEPLFANANVDVFYNGHKHIFYRTCPVRFGACASTRDPVTGAIQGTVYVTGGNAGRSLANPATQLLEVNPAYAAFATAYYNGTLNAFPDPFEAVNGGYHVNVSSTVYGYQRLTATATTLTFQPMDVTTIPAKPFADAAAAFTLTRLPVTASTTPARTSAPPATTAAPATTPAPATPCPTVTVAPSATCNCPVPETCPPPTTCPPVQGIKGQIASAVNGALTNPLGLVGR